MSSVTQDAVFTEATIREGLLFERAASDRANNEQIIWYVALLPNGIVSYDASFRFTG